MIFDLPLPPLSPHNSFQIPVCIVHVCIFLSKHHIPNPPNSIETIPRICFEQTSDPVSKGPCVTTVAGSGGRGVGQQQQQQQDPSFSLEICRRVAEKFVKDIITKATLEVSNISPTMKSNPEPGAKKVSMTTTTFILISNRHFCHSFPHSHYSFTGPATFANYTV